MSSPESTVIAAGGTHVGQRRLNEDAILIDSSLGLVLVADGVGGHEAGDVASAITCAAISGGVAAGLPLRDAVFNANREVRSAAAEGRGKEGMASTVVAAHFSKSGYSLAWVGDSRAYLWDGQLKLLTRDHSYVQSLVTLGEITREEARNHPRRHVIAQAIGVQDDSKLQVDCNQGRLGAGQLLLLCSDGLSDVVDSADISLILAQDGELQERCDQLVSAAVEAGGRDNISVVLIAGAGHVEANESAQTDIVWRFDPAKGVYSEEPVTVESAPTVDRVKPQTPREFAPDDAHLVSLEERALGQTPPKVHQRRGLWLLLTGGVIAALVCLVAIWGLPS